MAKKKQTPQKKLKLGLLGSSGKMGSAIRQIIKNYSRIECFAEICSHPTGAFLQSHRGVYEMDAKDLKQIDVWIDFSQPEALRDLLEVVEEFKTPLVSGTTGFSSHEQNLLKNAAKKTPIFWASNMSIGLWTVRQALKSFSHINYFDFALDEIHHTQKKDNPSGTAVTLHRDLENAVGKKIKPAIGHRLGGVYGVHTITAASQSEMIKLEHNALNRTVFAEGALKAALWVVNQKSGLYSMDDLMGENK